MLNWTSQHAFVETCQIKGQDESKCHNFIRVFHGPVFNSHYIDGNHQPKALAFSSAAIGSSSSSNSGLREVNEGQYLVCGTNAFKPTCRWYSPNLETYSKEFPGVGYSPFDPTHPSTSVLHHDSVYTATVADFGGTDALIYKQPLRTEQYFDVHLNSESISQTECVHSMMKCTSKQAFQCIFRQRIFTQLTKASSVSCSSNLSFLTKNS